MADVQLTVTFEPAGAFAFQVGYLQNGYRLPYAPDAPAVAAPVLRNMLDALKIGTRQALAAALNGKGQIDVADALFRLLFPAADLQPLFAALYASSFPGQKAARVRPDRFSARVRIMTKSSELMSLPWQLTGPDGRHLASHPQKPWTFELTTREKANENPQLPGPPKILAIIPRGARGQQHAEELRALLATHEPAYAAPDFFVHCRGRAELHRTLDRLHPQIVYFVGHAEEVDGAPQLQLDDGRLSGHDLQRVLPSSVLAAFFIGCGTGEGGFAGLGSHLADTVPAIVSGLTTLWDDRAMDLGAHWLRLVALDGIDPVTAVHSRPRHLPLGDFHAWTYAVHAHYDRWERSRPHPPPKKTIPISHRLDRVNQRAQLRMRVDGLLGRGRRVLAVVGCAPDDPGALADELGTLLSEDLRETRVHQLLLEDVVVDFPSDPRHLDLAIRRAFGCPEGAGLDPFITEKCPQARRGITPVLWLDFGTFGKAHQKLTAGAFRHWLDACDHLAAHCPDTVRIIAFMCVASSAHGRFAQVVHDYALEHDGERLMAHALQVLQHVDRGELAEFLKTPGATSCPKAARRDALRVLFEATAVGERANYRDLVTEIDYAEEIGWRRYLADAAPADDDFEA